ncbi:MAG: response regulator [Sediminimonas qiaohouensis]|uniref:histidine kinase n=1 Tax=Sediminimonas qiaohouensis TaxID=552061 RepID=A0A7C9H9S0_9RHOB|nr:PAS-domain containing protein [Sediminimonas qiaohouensis]MTJ03669.1 response regulator [Sediminimonas qiaohouensis]
MTPRRTDTAAMTMAGLNLIQQALSIYDSDLRLVVCNRPFQEMFDLPQSLTKPGAEFGETIRYLVTRGEYGDVEDIDAAVKSRVEQARAFEPHYMERTRPDGRTISVEGSPLPQGGWVTVYTDITHTKQQEALLRARSEELSDRVLSYAEKLASTNRKLESTITALEEAKRQLTETEARTRLTTEMMPAHIAHVDPERIYTFSNRRLNTVMPGRPSSIVGRHIGEALGQSAYDAIRPHLDAAFGGSPSVFEFTDEDSSRRIRAAFTPDRDPEDGGINGVYILSMDVTEETQARTALQQTRRREMAAQLTSGMAHDFSNLLTIILGSQSRLQRMELPQQARDLIAATLSAANRGGGLLNRIADITGAREWHPAPTDLPALLADLETLAAPALPPGISLNISNEIANEALLLDSGMLQDSLLNLILNARDACGDTGTITLDVHPVQDTWAEFSVTDSGPGFSPAALDHALEPFFSTKGGEGSGLGLAMVYDMTKLAGGHVRLANPPKQGGQVTMRLPLRPAPAPAHAAPGLVLLIEDSPDLREGVRAMLTDAGNAVIEAASVDEAMVLLNEVPGISLVLSDIHLEGDATGLDLLDRLAGTDTPPPCRLMTSLPPDDPMHLAAAARAPVLRKPFSAAALTDFLQPKDHHP